MPLVFLRHGCELKCQSQREETVCISKYERQKLQRLFTQGGAADAFVGNLVEASNLPVWELRYFYIPNQFLHTKISFMKVTVATPILQRMQTIARFKNET